MLPRPNRLRATPDFRSTVRRGVRVSRGTLVVHAIRSDSPPTRVGFVVSKAIGNAVVRNRVKRRLRHLTQAWIPASPFAVLAVVRALPGSVARPADVAGDFASAWTEAVSKLGAP